MSTNTTVTASGTDGAYEFSVNGKVIVRTSGREVTPNRDVVDVIYAYANDSDEARDAARAVAEAYAAGYDAGIADGVPLTERRARELADEQITKALDGLTVEVKR